MWYNPKITLIVLFPIQSMLQIRSRSSYSHMTSVHTRQKITNIRSILVITYKYNVRKNTHLQCKALRVIQHHLTIQTLMKKKLPIFIKCYSFGNLFIIKYNQDICLICQNMDERYSSIRNCMFKIISPMLFHV